jgi:Icc-related predicted phosphoesterase
MPPSKLSIQVMSDFHLEFHADGGRGFIDSLNPIGVDVLVVAGDLMPASRLEQSLAHLCKRYRRVVFVAGNHEIYDASPSVLMIARWDCRHLFNLHWLERDVVEIEGVRFVGTTLWFADTFAARANKHRLNDFNKIRDFVPWVYDENAKSVAFLRREVRLNDVVVTHHLPSYRSVAPQYKDSLFNAFFVCDVEDVIRDKGPQLWIHGHTHSSCDYEIGDTRVLCNPFGYAGIDVNDAFDSNLVVEVDRVCK